MFKKIALGALGVVALVVGGVGVAAARQPDDFRVERSIVIEAPPEKAHALVTDFHAWKKWSPFDKYDADMKRTYAGAGKGKGAIYTWSGANAGDGRMEITSDTPREIVIDLKFTSPMVANNVAGFTFAPEGKGTKVTWYMTGKNDAVSKVMCVFLSMDAMVGKDFEAGLTAIKTDAEKQG